MRWEEKFDDCGLRPALARAHPAFAASTHVAGRRLVTAGCRRTSDCGVMAACVDLDIKKFEREAWSNLFLHLRPLVLLVIVIALLDIRQIL